MMPSSSDLRYYLEVANTLNISRAAERLAVSQPSLTLAMRRLETLLGTRLLDRSKRGVRLTPAGILFEAEARRLLQDWATIKSRTLRRAQDIEGSFIIGCHPSVADYSLSGILPQLLSKYPGLEIHLQHDHSRKITEGVVSGKIDWAIVVNPVPHPDLIIHRLCQDEVCLWTTSNPSSCQRLGHPMGTLIFDPELVQSQHLLKRLPKNLSGWPRHLHSGSLEVIRSLVRARAGVGILPSRVAKLHSQLLRLPGSPSYIDQICIAHRVEQRLVPSIRALNLAAKEFFRQA